MSTTIVTPSGTAFQFEIRPDEERVVITTENGWQHEYMLRSLRDLYDWLRIDKERAWVHLGTCGEEQQPHADTVEEWARSKFNPVDGFYGLTPGRRGRFATYIPSVLEFLGFVELTHNHANNQVRAI